MTDIYSTTSKTQILNDNQVITKSHVDHFNQETERSRRDLGTNFCNESCDSVKNTQNENFFDYNIINLDSITVKRDPSSLNVLAFKKDIDD